MLIHATCEIASGSKLGMAAAKKSRGEGSRCPRPLCGDKALGKRRPTLIKVDLMVNAKVEKLFGSR
jgi:DNA-directed RNA polymerase subunit RPC12/RpoP